MANTVTESNASTIIGIDIGTSRISAVIARIEKRQAELLGFCTQPFDGTGWDEKEAKVNGLVYVIREVLNQFKQKERHIPDFTMIGISEKCLTANVMGSIALNGSVTEPDMRRAIKRAAVVVDIPEYMAILDLEVTSFLVDSPDGIPDPLGMACNRLGARLTALMARWNSLEIVSAACKRTGLEKYTTTASSLASATALLSDDEKKQGVCVLDMGSRLTSMVAYADGELDYIVSVPWGGNILTEFIGKRLRLEEHEAEKIKIAFSNGEIDVDSDQALVISNEIDKWGQRLCKLLERELDLHYWIHKAKDKFNLDFASDIVITGGASKLPGISEVLAEVFTLPVRQGVIKGMEGVGSISSEYASAVGLVLRGIRQNSGLTNIS